MLKILCTLLTVLLSLCVCVSADAGNLSLTGKIGYYSINGGDLKDIEFEDLFPDFDGSGVILGGEIDYFFTSIIGISLMVDYFNQREDFELLGYSAAVRQRLVPLSLNLKIRLPTPLIRPYAGGGIGAYLWEGQAYFRGEGINTNVNESGETIGLNLFGGVELSPGALISFIAEVRYHYLGKVDLIDPESIDFIDNTIRADLSGFQISGGVMLTF